MSRSNKSDLYEIRDMLKEEMDKFDAINDEIIENQNDFQKISDNYEQYNNLIDEGGSHVNDLTKQEYYENLFVYFGFYFFFGCVIYVVSKRIPIHKIIMLGFKFLYKIIMIFFPHKTENIPVSEKSMSEINTSFINETNKTNIGFIDGMNKTNISFINETYKTNISLINDITNNTNFTNITFNDTNILNKNNSSINDNLDINNTEINNRKEKHISNSSSNFENSVDKNNSNSDNINDL